MKIKLKLAQARIFAHEFYDELKGRSFVLANEDEIIIERIEIKYDPNTGYVPMVTYMSVFHKKRLLLPLPELLTLIGKKYDLKNYSRVK